MSLFSKTMLTGKAADSTRQQFIRLFLSGSVYNYVVAKSSSVTGISASDTVQLDVSGFTSLAFSAGIQTQDTNSTTGYTLGSTITAQKPVYTATRDGISPEIERLCRVFETCSVSGAVYTPVSGASTCDLATLVADNVCCAKTVEGTWSVQAFCDGKLRYQSKDAKSQSFTLEAGKVLENFLWTSTVTPLGTFSDGSTTVYEGSFVPARYGLAFYPSLLSCSSIFKSKGDVFITSQLKDSSGNLLADGAAVDKWTGFFGNGTLSQSNVANQLVYEARGGHTTYTDSASAPVVVNPPHIRSNATSGPDYMNPSFALGVGEKLIFISGFMVTAPQVWVQPSALTANTISVTATGTVSITPNTGAAVTLTNAAAFSGGKYALAIIERSTGVFELLAYNKGGTVLATTATTTGLNLTQVLQYMNTGATTDADAYAGFAFTSEIPKTSTGTPDYFKIQAALDEFAAATQMTY